MLGSGWLGFGAVDMAKKILLTLPDSGNDGVLSAFGMI